MDASSKALLNFSCDMLKEILKTEQNKNIFYSPLSIAITLKMVMEGAGGNTKSQMEKVLHVSQECSSSKQDCEGQHSSIKELLCNQTGKKYELKIANALFAENTFPLLDKYVQHMTNDFSAELKNVDFKKNAEAERQKINEWVKSKTNGKITDLYPKGSLNNSSVVALVNAVYFKGKWANQFDAKNTKEEPFNVNKNEKKTVQMMSKSGKFKYTELPEIKSKVLALPYEDGISMFIVLPDAIDGLPQVLSKATPDLIINWVQTNNLTETEVDVKIPKFKLEANYELVPKLKGLGMVDAFGANADLSGMSNTKGLFLSNVAHKSFIQVNEEGTEAAAATGAGVSVTSLPIRKPFIVDHPCIFFLIIGNKLILFQGVLVSP